MWQILSKTIALVSSVTKKGLAHQHQSPSRNTLSGNSSFRHWQTDVLPIPMVPPIRNSRFISDRSYNFLPEIISQPHLFFYQIIWNLGYRGALIVQFLDKSSRLGYNMDEREIRLDEKSWSEFRLGVD